LYIENPDLGYAHSGTLLYQMLGATYLGDGYGYTTGNVQSAAGQPGTFVAGMSYNYMYQQPPDNYVDYIGSNGGTILFRSQENYGRVICYAGPNNFYRSIYSTFNLGALRNGANTKLQLVDKYMAYLLETNGVGESNCNIIGKFTVYPNPAKNEIHCDFTLDRIQRIRIKIYDACGRIVRNLLDRELDRGFHQISWDRRDDGRKIAGSGVYIITLETEAEVLTNRLVLIR